MAARPSEAFSSSIRAQERAKLVAEGDADGAGQTGLNPAVLRSTSKQTSRDDRGVEEGCPPDGPEPINHDGFEGGNDSHVTFGGMGPDDKLLVEEGNPNDDANIVQAIYHKIHKTKAHKSNYITLGVFCAFTVIYCVILFLQANQQTVYQVTTAHVGLLPSGIDGTMNFDFYSAQDVYDWLNTSIIQNIWTAASCGNGICEHPEEFKAWGRFGCESDCGSNTNVSQIIITFTLDFPSAAAMSNSSWNLCMTSPTWNCWYSSYVVFTTETGTNVTTFSIPDGNWTLYLVAPYGGVVGSVVYNSTYNWTSSSSLTYGNTLVSWGNCKANITTSDLVQCREVAAYIAGCTTEYCLDNGVEITSNASFSGLFIDLLSICNADFHSLDAFLGYENCSAVAQAIQVNRSSFGSIVCSDYATPPIPPPPTTTAPLSALQSPPPPTPVTQRRRLLQDGAALWSFSTYSHLTDNEDVEEASRQQQAREVHEKQFRQRQSRQRENWSAPVYGTGGEGNEPLTRSKDSEMRFIVPPLSGEVAASTRRVALAGSGQFPSNCVPVSDPALNKTSSSSSVYTSDPAYPDPNFFAASKAVDGNTGSGRVASGSCSQTNSETSPWWHVDLGSSFYVDFVSIYNRLEGFSYRLDNLQVWLGSSDSTWNGTGNVQCSPQTAPYNFDVTNSFPVNVSCDGTGRFLWLVLPGDNQILTLCEVVPYACAGSPSPPPPSPPPPSPPPPSPPPPTASMISIWDKLGASDSERLFNLQAAVQRAMFEWVKDRCLAIHPKDVTRTAEMAAYLCTLFGGPVTLDGCGYRNESNYLVRTDEELALVLKTKHAGYSITREQSDQFVSVLIWGIQSLLYIEPATEALIINRVQQGDSEIVDTTKVGCPYVPNVLSWKVGSTYTTTVAANTGVEWVWADDEPHTIKSSALGDDPTDDLNGMGSGRLILSRNYLCSQANVGPLNLSLGPNPCNLQDPSATSNSFSFTKFFTKLGNFTYVDSRYADTTYGEVLVVETLADTSNAAELASLATECSSGCKIGDLKNGRCDFACNNYECAYDGGDCACPTDSNGVPVCTCPTGQVKASDGSCCQANAVGSNLEYTFGFLTWGPNLTVNDANFLPSAAPPNVRYVSVKNRVLIGMVLSQTRWATEECKDERFFSIYPNCTVDASTAHYGVNPVFLPTSVLYDAYFAANASLYYANLSLSYDNATIRNAQGVPYGFDSTSLGVSEPTFIYIFDINYNSQEALESLQYMADGFFIDNATKSLSVQLITFNGVENYFTLVHVKLTFQSGGKIAVKYDIDAVNPQPYHLRQDWFRFGLEIVFAIGVLVNLLGEIKEFSDRWRTTGHPLAHFSDVWNIVDLVSIGIMLAGIVLWVSFIYNEANPFEIEARYEVYDIVAWIAPGQFWDIVKPGTGFADALKAFARVQAMINFRALYFALQGINVLLMVLRILKLMDFQPRMGIITRTVARAAPDLSHFFLFFSVGFFGFAMYGNLVFGRSIDAFRTIAVSLNTCFTMLTGDDSVNAYLIELEGTELVAAVLFWWSYIIIMVFVTLNILIAIIVEAFVHVRERADGAPSMPEEVLWIARRWAARALTPLRTERQLMNSLLLLGADRQKEMVKYGYAYDGGASESANSVGTEPTSSQRVIHVHGQELDKEELLAIFRRARQRTKEEWEGKDGEPPRTVSRAADPELVADVVFSELSVAARLERQVDVEAEVEKVELSIEDLRSDVRDVKEAVSGVEEALHKLEEEHVSDRKMMADMMALVQRLARKGAPR